MTDARAKILSDMAAEDAKYIAAMPTREAVPDALVKAGEEAEEIIRVTFSDISYGAKVALTLRKALTLPRVTIEEAEARGAAKERERLAKLVEANYLGAWGVAITAFIRAQGGDS